MHPVIAIILLSVQFRVLAEEAMTVIRLDEKQQILRTGDQFTSVIRMQLPPHSHILQDSLPTAGLVNQQLALTDCIWQAAGPDAEQGELALHYQWLGGARNAEPVILPEIMIQIGRDGQNAMEIRIPEGQIRTTPRLAPDIDDAMIHLEPLHPFEDEPSSQAASIIRYGLQALGALMVMAGLRLHAISGRPRSAMNFQSLLKIMKQRPAHTHLASIFFSRLHESLHHLAGRNLGPEDVTAFVAEYPAFRPLADELQACLQAAEHYLYQTAAACPHGAPAFDQQRWLQLVRQCARIEKKLPP
ncbi:MAG: hypothetical protein RIQ52_829 [Pseudomonadota bacterium]